MRVARLYLGRGATCHDTSLPGGGERRVTTRLYQGEGRDVSRYVFTRGRAETCHDTSLPGGGERRVTTRLYILVYFWMMLCHAYPAKPDTAWLRRYAAMRHTRRDPWGDSMHGDRETCRDTSLNVGMDMPDPWVALRV